MADAGKPSITLPAELLDITAADFLDYLKERGAKPECPSCGKNDWAFGPELSSNLVSFGVMVRNELGRTDELVPVDLLSIVMMCRNCAFMRTHLLAQYMQHRRGAADER